MSLFGRKSKKKDKIKYSKGMKRRRFIATLATVLLGLALSLIIWNCSAEVVVNEYEKNMIHGLKDVCRQYSDDVEKDNLYEQSIDEVGENLAGFLKTLFMTKGVSEYTLDYADSYVAGLMNYYLFYGSLDHENKQANGYFIYQKERQQLKDCSKEELYDIISSGRVSYDDGYRIYSYMMNPGQYLMVRFRSTKIFTKKSALEAYAEDSDEFICRINSETGEIEDSCEQEYIGKNFDDYAQMGDGKTYNSFEPYKAYIIIDDNKQAVLYAQSEEVNGDYFVSIIPTNILIPAITRSSIVGVVLCWAFLFIILHYVIAALKNIEDSEKSVKFVPITRKLCIDIRFFSHVAGLTVFAIVLTILSMLYVQTMTNYSTQNEKARTDLKGLEQHIDLNIENANSMESDFFSNCRTVMEIISSYLVAFPEECSDCALSEMVNNLSTISRITLYDSNGVSEYDSEGVFGVSLTHDDSSGESKFWDVLSGDSTLEYYATSSENETFYNIAIMRQDTEGLIRIKINGDCLEKFCADSSIQKYVMTANMGASERGYIDKDKPDTLYWIREGDERFKEYTNTLSESVLTHGYSGMARIRNIRQLVNVRDTRDRYLICGKSTSYLFGIQSVMEYLSVTVLLLLQYLILAFLSAKKRETVEADEVNVVGDFLSYEEMVRERAMDKEYRKLAVWMLLSALFMIVVTLLVDSGFGNTSILAYLFGSTWTKGINLFSVTMIMMLIAGVVLGGKLLELLVMFFTKNMGPRGVTLGKMSCSLIRFAALVIVLVVTLVDLGADLKALLASAGIAGAMLTFCAQQTVNDLLSGFFIIFENSINIGDWICVDDFRGEIIEIGVRITKVSAGGSVKIVNNSDLRNIDKLCKEMSGAYCEFEIAYKEDAQTVLELLKSKSDYLKEKIPRIDEGPYFDGVLDLGSSGVKLRVWAHGHRDYVMFIERELRRNIKEILDENGVEIPFTQVTLHMSDDKQ